MSEIVDLDSSLIENNNPSFEKLGEAWKAKSTAIIFTE